MRRLARWTAPIVALATVGACGGRAASAQEIVAGSSDKTAKASTARVTEVITTTSAAGQPTVPTVTSTGVMDFAGRRAVLDFDLKGQRVKVMLDGTTIYELIPSLADQLGDKPWIKIDLNDLGQLSGITGLGDLAKTSDNDPGARLEALRGAGTVQRVGHDTVRGVQTTRYHAIVDLEAAAKQAPAAQQATLRQIATAAGVSTQAVDVWIDGQGRVRRLVETVDTSHIKQPAKGAAVLKDVTVSLEYYDFGTPARVEVPAAGQATDFGAMLLKLKNRQGSGSATAATSAIQAKLITAIPAGYQRLADSVGDAGPSDLDKAVRDDGSPDARQVLTRDGFLGGYQRSWKKGPSLLLDMVYQFSPGNGAADYAQRSLVNLRSSGGVSEFAVVGLPGAKGLRHTDSSGTSILILFTRGSYVAQVAIDGANATPQLVAQLAQQQFAKLA